MQSQQKWQVIIGKVLQGTPYEFVGAECIGGGKHTVLRVYVDKPGGINIDDITKISREVSVVLDVEEPIKGSYTLEVSSPGLQRPLFTPEHFQAQVGKKISLRTSALQNNRQNYKGLLQKADEHHVEIECEGQVYSFGYSDIDKGKVIPEIEIGAGGSRK